MVERILVSVALIAFATASTALRREQAALDAGVDEGLTAAMVAAEGAALERELAELWETINTGMGGKTRSQAGSWAEAAGYQLMHAASSKGVPSGKGECLGLPKADCKPCPKGEQNLCADSSKRCKDIYCSPICLSLGWSCNIGPGKGPAAANFTAAMTVEERQALCAQFIGHACSKMFKCCAADDALTDWVDGFGYGEASAAPLLPIAPCMHDPGDAKARKVACDLCKASIKLEVAATPERCVFGSPRMASTQGAPDGKDKKPAKGPVPKGGGSFKVLEERVSQQTTSRRVRSQRLRPRPACVSASLLLFITHLGAFTRLRLFDSHAPIPCSVPVCSVRISPSA